MNEASEWELLPDEDDPNEETVSTDELFADLMSGFAASEAYQRGEIPLRVTEGVGDSLQSEWRYIDGPAFDRYRLVIEWHASDRRFVATLPELADCQADGETQEMAISHLREVFDHWMDQASREGHPIPRPQSLNAAA